MVVAVERHEDLVVVADQLLPQHLAVVGLERTGAVGIDVEQLVVRQDHRQGRVLRDHLARPGDARGGDAPRQRQHHELLALRLEHVVLVETARVAPAEGGLLLRALGAEPLDVGLLARVAVGVGAADRVDAVVDVAQHVVVAGQHAVGQLRVLEQLHRRIGHLPLVGLADLVDHVAEVDGEGDVERLGVVGDPLRLRGEGRAAEALVVLVALGRGGVARIELGVGHHGQREARDLRCDRWRRCRRGGRRGGRGQGAQHRRAAATTATGGEQRAAAAEGQQRGAELEQVAPRRRGGFGCGRRGVARLGRATRIVGEIHCKLNERMKARSVGRRGDVGVSAA